jgi:hypothetical protein
MPRPERKTSARELAAAIEAAGFRGQLKKVLSAWTERSKADLEFAQWHFHKDTDEDILIVIGVHGAVFRVAIQPMELGAIEERRREWEKQKAAEGAPLTHRPGRPRGS